MKSSSLLQENMMQDLTAVRELCMKLDQTRESLSRQLAAKSLDQEQVRIPSQTSKLFTHNAPFHILHTVDT